MFRASLLFVSLAAAAPVALAQTADHLVGLTRNLGDLRHASQASCSVLATCSPAGFPSAAGMPATAGGTAWDPTRSGAWISNGQFLACVDDNCNYLCAPMPIPGLGGGVFVQGLEVVESRNELWIVDSSDTLRVMSLTCPPVPLASCPVVFLDPTFTTTGLAVDELRGLVFYSRTQPAIGMNVIAYADLAAPCAVLAGTQMVPCPGALGSTTGLACDAGANTLYTTDGLRMVSIRYSLVGIALSLFGQNCCPPVAAGVDPVIGLAVRPGRATTNGVACANGACPGCGMGHSLNGDPVLGNSRFGYHLGGAPAGSFAWCIVGAGPCAAPGISIPALCGPIYASPVLGTLGLTLVAGGVPGGCGGTADFAMSLPPALGLAGLVLSSQCVVMCSTPAGFGTSVSNCLSFALQGI